MYERKNNFENLQKKTFVGTGPLDIPVIFPEYELYADNWISFNYAKGCDDPELHGVHFFLDDYQFQRLWVQPDTYMKMLKKFKAVCSPDYSMFTDFPKAVQIWSHYRKHWLAAYWQANGIKVIPTINWSDHDSYDWCFDGEPTHSVVAISSISARSTTKALELYHDGYDEMMKRLQPSQILLYGDMIDGLGGNIVNIPAFTRKRWRTAKEDLDE